MGVYIKGMVMPYGCANCDFVSEPIYDAKGRAMYVCNVPVEEVCGKRNTDEVIALYEGASEAFPDWCPLVEVPEPHGDLIDRDKVIPKLNFINEAEHQIYGRASWGFTAKCIHAFDDAPPVIEAEDE